MHRIFLILALGILVSSLGCSNKTLIIDIGNIPPVATELRVFVRLGDKQSVDAPRFPFAAGHSTYTIGLNLKGQNSGTAQITLAAFLNGCILSSGRLDIADLATAPEESSVNLDPMASDVSDSSCPDSPVILQTATTMANPATGGNILVVTGFGFAPSAQVLLDKSATPATGYVSQDPRSFQVDLPRLIPPVDHALHIVVLQPDGSTGSGDFTVSIPVFESKQPVLYPTSASDPFRLLGPVYADDVDGDGFVDLIASSKGDPADSGALQVYFNDGTGTFPVSKTIILNSEVRDVAALKLRTGKLKDLAVTTCHTPFFYPKTSYNRCNLVIVQQLTARNFTSQLLSRDGSEPNGQQSALVVGDGNADGIMDVYALTNSSTTPFAPVKLTGLQSFLKIYDGTALTNYNFNVTATKTLSGPAVALALGQLRPVPSGQLDLAIAEYTSAGAGVVEVFQNPGNGRFDQATPTQLAIAGRPGKLTTGDFDSDGHTDLAVALYQDTLGSPGTTANAFLRRNLTWSQQTVMTGLAPLGLVTMDLLSDGSSDLVVANSRSGTQSARLGLLFNLHQGVFSSSIPTSISLPTTSDANLAVADFNGDGHQDLAVSSYGISGQAGIHAGTLSILFGL